MSLFKKERKRKSLDIRGNSVSAIKRNGFLKKIAQNIEEYPFIEKLRNSYSDKLNIINKNEPSFNRSIATLFILANAVISLSFVFFLSLAMNVWYVLFVIGAISLYLNHYIVDFYLNIKLKKIRSQFPAAIQLFTDIYITNRNIKMALNTAYKEMPAEVAGVFERLSRELSSSYDYQEHIKQFAKSLGYVWGYAFSELLLMSYEGGGDISQELIYLNELINDDIQDSEETKSEMAGNKMLFLIITIVTAIAFVLNIMFNPVAKQLYFYTPTGNILIMGWMIVIAAGVTTTAILDNL